MRDFDFVHRPRIVFGCGASARVGELALAENATRVLLVSDNGVLAAGHTDAVAAALRDHRMSVAVFTDVHENPTHHDVSACVELARRQVPDLIIGLGGGSALDVAKACNMVCAEGSEITRHPGTTRATKPHRPMIAIPTTAGTGSECQAHAVISDAETGAKTAFATSESLPKTVILDPVLTLTQPRRVTVHSGLDAIVHAVEVTVTTSRNPLSTLFAAEAFGLLNQNLPIVLASPDDLDARGAMQLGAALAGLAIAHSMLGAAHAAGNPLTARYHITHGESVASMLPAVIRFNAQDDGARACYADLAARAGLAADAADPHERVQALLTRLAQLWSLTGNPPDLAGYGVRADDVDDLAVAAAQQWTGTFNPRPVDADAFRGLYLDALAADAGTVLV
ncbi:MAG TPA: iron-containing alcohol dehydrogenase [Pseudonocardiaceae bacterium]